MHPLPSPEARRSRSSADPDGSRCRLPAALNGHGRDGHLTLIRRAGVALGSLRWRLTLTYAGFLALLLAGLGTYEYVSLRTTLISVRVTTLTGDLTTGRLDLQRNRASGLPRAGKGFCAATGAARNAAARDYANAVTTASGRSVAVVIFDRTLEPLATPAQPTPLLDRATLAAVLGGTRSPPRVLDAGSGPQLVVAFPIVLAGTGRVCGIAQLASSTEAIDEVLANERGLLVGGAALGFLAAGVAGILITGRALAPLRRLTETAQSLAAGDLRARSRLAPRGDEVGRLASAFDDMADRIEVAFDGQAQSEARIRRFIADASHELRTPITALKGFIDVMRRGAGRDPDVLDGVLEAMGREADRMRVLVLDLLTLARLDARRPYTSEAIDVAAEVARVLDEGVPGMPGVVDRRLPPALALADREALATIVRNLLVNACKYAPGAAQHWAVEPRGDQIALIVRDEGPGVSPADLPHVFERFYRGEKTRARDEGGSGLGLSIVQGLARAQGGDAAIESSHGDGTTVTVLLPRAP